MGWLKGVGASLSGDRKPWAGVGASLGLKIDEMCN